VTSSRELDRRMKGRPKKESGESPKGTPMQGRSSALSETTPFPRKTLGRPGEENSELDLARCMMRPIRRAV